jgi:Ni/Fe-hydrogenase subunit HybB-like protein
MSGRTHVTSRVEPPARPAPPASRTVAALALAGIAIGVVSFLVGAASRDPAPAWSALLINFLFWSSLAQGAFIWSVAFRLARTTWSGPVNRLGHSAVSFLGITIGIFVVLVLGRRFYLPSTDAELTHTAAWLSTWAVLLRDGAGLVALFLLARTYVGIYLKADDAGEAAELEQPGRRLSVLGVLLAITYTIVSTLIGIDLVMSLAPGWYSALFGWYYMLGGLYAGMAALIAMALLPAGERRTAEPIGRQQRQDLGNLLMAFALAMTYFFYAQALTIWYGNLPAETTFALARIRPGSWRTLSIAAIGIVYLGPFLLLLLREMKESRRWLLGVALLVLFAMWFERYMLVMPSLASAHEGFPILVLLVGVGFLGAFALSTGRFLARRPGIGPLDRALLAERDEQ